MGNLNKTIAVAYLARGADKDWFASCERYLNSYKSNHSGLKHSLYVIFKGFGSGGDLKKAEALFSCIKYKPVFLRDDSFDIGAYIELGNTIEEDLICVFNTASEILTTDWLRKLVINLTIPGVGLVGATGSYESLYELNTAFPTFPNIHIRSTAFMIERKLFCKITNGLKISNKIDAFYFESGPKSLSKQILASGKKILLVGRNGRGYSPQFWPKSDTFRQGDQANLLVADNQTRNFSVLNWGEKREFIIRTWGKYINDTSLKSN